MIIDKNTKCYSFNSCFPNENFTNLSDDEVFVVDETNPENKMLISKVLEHSPYMDFVTNEAGDLIDIIPLPKPEPDPLPSPEPSIEELYAQQLAQAEAIASLFEMLTGGEA